MAEVNPYEGPKTSPSATNLERRFALQLLKVRERGYNLRLHYKWQAKSYLILGLYFALSFAFFWSLDLHTAAAVFAGIMFGVLLRDYGIAKGQKRIWPIQCKILDWDKVLRMSEGESIPMAPEVSKPPVDGLKI